MSEKNFEFEVESLLYEQIKKPIREITDIVLLIIEVLSYIMWKPVGSQAPSGLKIVISKMRRIFFVFDEKSFSVAMPFYIKQHEDGNLEVYDNNVILDSKILSCVKSIVTNMDFNNFANIDLDSVMQDEYLSEREKRDARYVFYKLITTEYGYIRYDDDLVHESGLEHPRYHLDVNYSNGVTFKMALPDKKEYAWLKDLLDITTQCKKVVD